LIRVTGASRRDEAEILTAMDEVLGPVTNPRYLLEQASLFAGLHRVDYHALPSAIGARKDLAEIFRSRWNWRVGQLKLRYLRNPEGRRLLLRARAGAFAAGFQAPFERYSVWQ
jgi:hypothetical protein